MKPLPRSEFAPLLGRHCANAPVADNSTPATTVSAVTSTEKRKCCIVSPQGEQQSPLPCIVASRFLSVDGLCAPVHTVGGPGHIYATPWAGRCIGLVIDPVSNAHRPEGSA